MKYRRGELGRIFIARLEHEDNLLDELEQLAKEEKIEAAIFYVIGALKEASLVVGPKECAVPPTPVWRKFDDCREIIGVGTLFRDEQGQPVLHLHGTMGRGDAALTGCIRDKSEVYLVAEVIILELTGAGAVKELDPVSGLKKLDFLG